MFEWDETKRASNLEKHKLDFLLAPEIFDGRPTLNVPADYQGEARYLTVALLEGRCVTVVWTWRGEARRIISLRRSRDGEKSSYREVHGG